MTTDDTKKKIAEVVVRGRDAIRVDRTVVSSETGFSKTTIGKYFDQFRDELQIRHVVHEDERPDIVRAFIFVKLRNSDIGSVREFKARFDELGITNDFFAVEGIQVDVIIRLVCNHQAEFISVHQKIAELPGVKTAESAHRIREEHHAAYTELSL